MIHSNLSIQKDYGGLEGMGTMDMSEVLSEQFILQLNWELPVEFMQDFDAVLLFGKLAAISPEEITIRRTSNKLCFPIVDVGRTLLIRCYDIQMAPVILRARVTRSSGMECTVGDLDLIPYKTQRRDTRYPLCPPVMIPVWNDTAREQIQLCQLLNISVSGACIVTQCAYDVGQALQLQLSPEKVGEGTPYSCKVVRATPRRGGYFEYGLLFKKLDKNQIRCLKELLRD